MNEQLLWAAGVGLALTLAGIGLLLISRQRTQATIATERLSPSARRRQTRDVSIINGVRLAAMLSRVDGEVHATELNAIHDFITQNVRRADIPFASRIMRAGLDGEVEVSRNDAVAEILAIGDAEHRELVVDLLVFVARADGQIHPAERTFLEEVAPLLGMTEVDLNERLNAAAVEQEPVPSDEGSPEEPITPE